MLPIKCKKTAAECLYAGTGARKRANGLRLVATDIGWSAGTGPEVRGRGETLLMALAGRSVGATALEGDGVAAFTERTLNGSVALTDRMVAARVAR